MSTAYSPDYLAHLEREKAYLDVPVERFLVTGPLLRPSPAMQRPRWLSHEERDQHDDLGNAPHLLSDRDRERIFGEEPDWFRAAGACRCWFCGRAYNDHQSVIGARWLTRLCDHTLVKL